jgi:hypothetical protein
MVRQLGQISSALPPIDGQGLVLLGAGEDKLGQADRFEQAGRHARSKSLTIEINVGMLQSRRPKKNPGAGPGRNPPVERVEETTMMLY